MLDRLTLDDYLGHADPIFREHAKAVFDLGAQIRNLPASCQNFYRRTIYMLASNAHACEIQKRHEELTIPDAEEIPDIDAVHFENYFIDAHERLHDAFGYISLSVNDPLKRLGYVAILMGVMELGYTGSPEKAKLNARKLLMQFTSEWN